MPTFTDQLYTFSLSSGRNTVLLSPTYIYISDPISNTEPDIDNNVESQLYIARNLIAGKRILPSDVYFMVRRIEWASGTVYDMYNDDVFLGDKDFFVLASNRAVYKCLSNNNGAPSTIEPTSLDPAPFELSDGYIWRFMYRLTEDDINNRMLPTLMPVREDSANPNVISGSLDYIEVVSPGSNYPHYSGSIEQVLSSKIFRLPNDAPNSNGIFTNSALYFDTGPASGSISVITDYVSNTSGRFVTVQDDIANASVTSSVTISPQIRIDGDGAGASARAILTSNTISSVEMLNSGSGYTYATAVAVANSFVGNGAVFETVVSPFGGHGSSIAAELFSRNLTFFVTFQGNELGTIPDDVTFSVFGIMAFPRQFSNPTQNYTANTFDATSVVELSYINGTFQKGDKITSGTTKSAVIASTANNEVRIIYDKRVPFAVGDEVRNQSGVIATVENVTHPDIYPHSGIILLGNPINSITRSPDTKELFTITLST